VNYNRVFAVGASAGGIEALLTIVQQLPADFPAPILIVVHISPDSPGYLPDIMAQNGRLPATNSIDGTIIENGRIYFAPPDRHLVVDKYGKLHTPRGPRENYSRPAIDPLFRSVALGFGERSVGIVLSGGLNDGAAGLRAVKLCGGTTIIQDPSDAIFNSMPLNAMRNTTIDYCLPASEIGSQMSKLAQQRPTEKPVSIPPVTRQQIAREIAKILRRVRRLDSSGDRRRMTETTAID
jgi:two-component system chemotaxis response regulator CheB